MTGQGSAPGEDTGGRPARRQAEMADVVIGHGSASAAELAKTFRVSLMTVHRDLDELERQGVVRKHRGGASAQPSSVFESNVAYRKSVARREKQALAEYARQLVEPGMAVMLDDSTTVLEVVRLLPQVGPLTVATNVLEAIGLLTRMERVRLLALGGQYHPTHDSFLGVPCIEAVEGLHPDLLLTSTSAVSATHAFHQEQEIVLVKRAMMRAAHRSVLLVDHGKFQRSALHRLAPLSEFDLVVTDERTPEEDVRALREHGARVEIAPV